MNPVAGIFLAVNAIALFLLPRRLAALPLLLGTCYMTRAQGADLGPISFTFVRLLLVVGLFRVAARGEWHIGRNRLDGILLAWGMWMLLSAVFHKDAGAALITRSGLVFDAWGVYFLFRALCRSWGDVIGLYRLVAIVLIPISIAMLVEKSAAHNVFSVVGGVPETPSIRAGKVRAQGPFSHSILAGTIGATALPLMIGLWRVNRSASILGSCASITIVYASTSSGPILSAGAGIAGLLLWKLRYQMWVVRWGAVAAYAAANVVMRDPPYYILAHINLIGGSTGWYRASLIDSALTDVQAWWLAGTDYTRHWSAMRVHWSADHTDITNHFLKMAVFGGLPLLILFVMILWCAFSFVGRRVREKADDSATAFLLWSAGASLFAHAVTCTSVSYFDQSVVFFYLGLATIGSAWNTLAPKQNTESTTVGAYQHSAGTVAPACRRRARFAVNPHALQPSAKSLATSIPPAAWRRRAARWRQPHKMSRRTVR